MIINEIQLQNNCFRRLDPKRKKFEISFASPSHLLETKKKKKKKKKKEEERERERKTEQIHFSLQ